MDETPTNAAPGNAAAIGAAVGGPRKGLPVVLDPGRDFARGRFAGHPRLQGWHGAQEVLLRRVPFLGGPGLHRRRIRSYRSPDEDGDPIALSSTTTANR